MRYSKIGKIIRLWWKKSKVIQIVRYTVFLDWKNKYCQMAILPKVIYKFKAIPIKIHFGIFKNTMAFFTKLEQIIFKFVWKYQWHHQQDGLEFGKAPGVGWWIGKPGMLQSMGSQRVGHNWVTELNWCKH